jgi:hypothetical protein
MMATSSKTTKNKSSENVIKAGFAQPGDSCNRKDIECFRCGKKGHIARYCKETIPNQNKENKDDVSNNEEDTTKEETTENLRRVRRKQPNL